MPKLNHKGPDGEGSKTGRGLGRCLSKEEKGQGSLGEGRGFARKSGVVQGKGLRLKSSELFDNQKNIRDEDCNSNKR